jgi:hypothetical protein
MRHLSTLIAAVFVAPLSWILVAFGQDRSAQAFANAQHSGAFDTGDFVRPVIFLAGAGLLLGLLATLRFSPLGVVLTGAGYAASYLALLVDPDRVLDLFPDTLSLGGHSVDPTIPLRTGTAMLLGALMLVATVSIGRWRRWPAADELGEQFTEEQGPDRPVGVDGLGLNAPASATEPELVARYVSTPRRSSYSGPNSYERPGEGGADPWQGNRQSPRPPM